LHQNNQYKIYERLPEITSEPTKKKIKEKMEKVIAGNANIIEISRLDNPVHIDYKIPNRTPEDTKRLMNLEMMQMEATRKYVEEHEIDIVISDVIES
jgi:hypothetical protein